MKQKFAKTPQKSLDQKYLSDTKIYQARKNIKYRYKYSLNSNDSKQQSFQSNKYKKKVNNQRTKRAITQIQQKSIKSVGFIKKQGFCNNEKQFFINKIKSKILSDKTLANTISPQFYPNQLKIQEITFKKRNRESNYQNKVDNFDNFAKTHSYFKQIQKNQQINKFYLTFTRNSQFQNISSKLKDSHSQTGFKQENLSLIQIRQKKIAKYINQFYFQSLRQLEQLQKVAHDKFHKKSGKEGMALQRIFQMRQFLQQIVQNLTKYLFQKNTNLENNQTIFSQLPQNNDSLQKINMFNQAKQLNLQKYFQGQNLQKDKKQGQNSLIDRKQQSNAEKNENVSNISMIQEPPKQTVEGINNQLQNTIKDFLNDIEQFIKNKKQLYEKLRNKFVNQFPQMLDKYNQYEIKAPDKIFQSTLKIQKSPSIKNIKKKDPNRVNESVNKSSLNQTLNKNSLNQTLNKSKLNESFSSTNKQSSEKQKYESLDTQKLLQLIFKRAYFFSKSKNKVIQTKTPNIQQKKVEEQKCEKQVKYSYLKYLRGKQKKEYSKKLKFVKGQTFIKQKQKILAMENQGSYNYSHLKNCLDQVIQISLKQYQKTRNNKTAVKNKQTSI